MGGERVAGKGIGRIGHIGRIGGSAAGSVTANG